MQVKKASGRAYGVNLSAAERKAMEKEIRRQLAVFNEKNCDELDAMILWYLHEEFGFGEKRLKKVYFGLADAVNGLVDRYQMDDGDQAWLCTKKLKDYGIDISKWKNERDQASEKTCKGSI